MSEGDFRVARVVNEEFKVWKKNQTSLYDLSILYGLEWPSLTCEWIPGKRMNENRPVNQQRLILGTHAPPSRPNFLLVLQVTLPNSTAQLDFSRDAGREGRPHSPDAFHASEVQVQFFQRMRHDGEVNRARAMPQNPLVIASRTTAGPVHLFQLQNQPTAPKDSSVSPNAVLSGLGREGFGLSWSPVDAGRLAACDESGHVALWDAIGEDSGGPKGPLRLYESEAVIEDVCWHHTMSGVFVTGDSQHGVKLWDSRTPSPQKVAGNDTDHVGAVNSVDCCPSNENLIVSGSDDCTVRLFDKRKFAHAFHTARVHDNAVMVVKFSPFCEPLVASAGVDRRVFVWDMSRIGASMPSEYAREGPPELMFVHGGHTSVVADISWNPNPDDHWLMASVAHDNVLHLWKMAESIYSLEDVMDVDDGPDGPPLPAPPSESDKMDED